MASNDVVQDANIRLIEVNGQTILLEGDMSNVSNEILEEILTDKREIISKSTDHVFSEVNGLHVHRNEISESWGKVNLVTTAKTDVQVVDYDSDEAKDKIKTEIDIVEDEIVQLKTEKADHLEETLLGNISDVYHTEIAHLEDFQIPTAEDGTLLPATVNAKMADGTYQMLTLTPQIQDGNVTYTVQFTDLNIDINNCVSKTNNIINKVTQSLETLNNSEPMKNNNTLVENTSQNKSMPFVSDAELPKLLLESKISNLISENDAVISRCKKIEYGNSKKESKDNQSSKRGRKVKFKPDNKEPTENKKSKLSLLKTINPVTAREEAVKTPLTTVPVINLNASLQYPVLNNLDEPDSLSIRNQISGKPSFYNIVQPPLDINKLELANNVVNPVSCNAEQYKNLMKLKQFLEEQDYQLKILPKRKMKLIKPKPSQTQPQQSNTNDDSQDLEHRSQQQPPQQQQQQPQIQQQVNIDNCELDFSKFKNLFIKDKSEGNDVNNDKNDGILVKNNPIFFNNKIGKNDKVDNKYPLGSTENPIQLLQTGQTFHSRQPLSESQLKAIASILQKQSLEKNKRSSVFDAKTNTRIVYRVVYPDEVELKWPSGEEKEDKTEETPKKRGRHKSKGLVGEGDVKKGGQNVTRGRPKLKKPEDEEEDVAENSSKPAGNVKKIARTRSGRVSRPPKYMVKDYKRIHTADVPESCSYDSDGVYSDYQTDEPANQPSDKTEDVVLLPGLHRQQSKGKRNVKPQYRCPTCQKIYLGYSKMMRHLVKFPDHCTVEKYEEIYIRNRKETNIRTTQRYSLSDMSKSVKKVLTSMTKDEMMGVCGSVFAEALTMWDFLLLRVNLTKSGGGSEVNVLLDELSVLLEKLAKIAEDILFPVFTKSTEQDTNYVEIDKLEIGIALGLPTGLYKVNEKNLDLLRTPTQSSVTQDHENMVESSTGDKVSETIDDISLNVVHSTTGPDCVHTTDANKSSFLNETWQDKNKTDVYWNNDEVGNKSPVASLATKFEPNLSTKIMESSNESIDDTKFELIDLDSNSKDIERSTSCENLNMGEKKDQREEVGSQLWNDNSTPVTSGDKVDETNCQLLDRLLSVDENNQFLTNTDSSFMNDKQKQTNKGSNFIGLWNDTVVPSTRASRLTSTPECNETSSFNIPNRRNSISDFTNLDSNLYDKTKLVLPPAETLIKKSESFSLETNSQVQNNFINTTDNTSRRMDPVDDIMNISLDSLRHNDDVIPPSSFEGIGNILNNTQPNNNLIFPTSESDGLDFNLSLPEHLLRGSSTNDSFISSNNNLFSTTNNITNSLSLPIEQNFHYFPDNFVSESTNNFPPCFPNLQQDFNDKKIKNKKVMKKKKKIKKKKVVDNDFQKCSIESIINEALFDKSTKTSLEQNSSSHHTTNTLQDNTNSFSLPIITDSLDEVGNLDFLNQD